MTKADLFRGKLEGGRVLLEFAVREGADPGAMPARLTDRVALTPDAARRLAIALDDVLRRQPRVVAPAPRDAAAIEQQGEQPVNAAPDESGAVADALLAAVRGLGAPFRQERSFRLARGSLQAHRFLLTVTRADVGGDAPQRVQALAERLGLPDSFLAMFDEHFAHTGAVHFGFEAGAGGALLKLYLEQAVHEDVAARAASQGEGVLQHIACKWNPVSGESVVSRYLWYPGLDTAGISARLDGIYDGAADGFSANVARQVLTLAASRAPGVPLHYLEIDEPGNARRSFDLNLYDALLRVQDLQPQLAALRDHYGVRPGQFQALYDQVKQRALGHLAGGVHRDGGDFFNVYHAAS